MFLSHFLADNKHEMQCPIQLRIEISGAMTLPARVAKKTTRAST
jgi:hypothetical protein